MQQSRGFTLIELMVAVSLVSVVIVSLLTVFSSFIQQQVDSQYERNALNAIRFLIADITRDVSFGTDYACGQKTGGTCTCLALTDQLQRRVKIRYNATDKRVEKAVQVIDVNPNSCVSADPWTPLTDTAVRITGFSFTFDDEDSPSQVKIAVSSTYTVGDKSVSSSFRTQVARRVISPDEESLSTLTIGAGDGNEVLGSLSYFIYNSEGTCLDESGTQTSISQCKKAVHPVAVEITTDGMYLLAENGLLFRIPVPAITKALSATAADSAKSIAEVLVPTSAVQQSLTRVIGKGSRDETCRGCDNDPVNIRSIHPARDYLYAISRSGDLYKIDEGTGELILDSADNNTVRLIDSNNYEDHIVILYTHGGSQKLRLFDSRSIDASDLSGSCSEFTRGGSESCRQLIPDPDETNDDDVQPESLGDIALSSINQIQKLKKLVLIWHRSGGSPRTLIVEDVAGDVSKLLADGLITIQSGLGNLFLNSKKVVSNGSENILASSKDETKFSYVEYSSDRWSVFPGTLKPDSEDLLQHSAIKRRWFGISSNGRLTNLGDGNVPIEVYKKNTRLFCGTVIQSMNGVNRQVRFVSMSHPLASGAKSIRDIIALVGRSIQQDRGRGTDVYLLTERKGKVSGYQYGTTTTLCSDSHVERYDLPVAIPGSRNAFNSSIFRITGLQLVDPVPKP